jgi:hypothetical protein
MACATGGCTAIHCLRSGGSRKYKKGRRYGLPPRLPLTQAFAHINRSGKSIESKVLPCRNTGGGGASLSRQLPKLPKAPWGSHS